MSTYTTGELARACGVTVRTVQYYDTRGLLAPSALTEGGRRLYSEDDLRQMKIICFLRSLGLPIHAISQLLSDEDPGVILLLLEQQSQVLGEELRTRQDQLNRLEALRRELQGLETLSVESIGDIAYTMENRQKMKRLHRTMLLTGLPLNLFQWVSILLWALRGIWIPFAVWLPLAVVYGVWVTRYYFDRVEYLCPKCHTVFRPTRREAFFAGHTPRTRKLACPGCGEKRWCVETYAEPK